MSDKQASAEAAWADAWADMQRKYWEAWSGLARPMAGTKPDSAAEAAASPWSQSLDLWAKMMAPAMSEDSRSWMEKVLAMNKGYLQMGEALFKAVSAGQESGRDFGQWWNTVSQSLTKLQEQVASGFGATKDPWGGFATLWGLPMDTWKRLASACSVMPGDMEKAFRDIAVSDDALASLVGHWLSTPTLGYTRESQEETQRLGQLWMEHGQAVQAYTAVLSRVVVRAGELLREKMLAKLGKGESFDSLRACYDLWVDCGEEAYAELSVSADYTRAQAKLTNSLMAVKRQEQKMVDEVLGALNMPTRRELDTSHRRLHRLQRSVWRMQQAIEEAGVQELRDEVAGLRRQVNELSGAAALTATPSAAAPKRSVKPKAAT